MAGNKRKIQEINAGSMADISFLLLIFFLVATTMSNDKGILRTLPPMPPEDMELEDNKVKERNLMKVFVNSKGEVSAADGRDGQNLQYFKIADPVESQRLTDKVLEFILNPTGDELLPEMQEKVLDIPLGEDKFKQVKHMESLGVVSLQTTRDTPYLVYIQVQDALTRAFNEVRNQVSVKLFNGRKFTDLNDDEKKVVSSAVQIKISEAEPRQKASK